VSRERLEPRQRVLIRVSAALAARDSSGLERALAEGARLGIHLQVEEVLLQSYLFLGYPIALNAFALWRNLTGREAGEGVLDEWAAWEERGEEVCRVVYAGQYEGLRRNVKALHPDMERWMVAEGYGKVLGRPGLDLGTRELCIAALLAVLRTPTQLYSHLRGALNAGVPNQQIEDALAEVGGCLDEEGLVESRVVWDRVRTRGAAAETSASAGPPQKE
jgi:4-carboxymuconolactone decarboxylase